MISSEHLERKCVLYHLFELSLKLSLIIIFLAAVLFLRKKKTVSLFLLSFKSRSGSWGERDEILSVNEPQSRVSTAFSRHVLSPNR